jgi:lipid II:glycine glycyltransferase (peptidoglycan interpeptide bridge formation enzyme)
MYSISDFSHDDWNDILASFSGAHVLQTHEWGQVKARVGWKPVHKVWKDDRGEIVGMAMILVRTINLSKATPKIKIIYIPKGPILDWRNQELRKSVLLDLEEFGQSIGALFVKIDPDVEIGFGIPDTPESEEVGSGENIQDELLSLGWRYSDDQIQYKNSMLIDLSQELDTILANMKQKTRYNIRLAGRKGIVIREGTERDIDLLYEMYAETSMRDGFVIRDRSYYESAWGTFMPAEIASPMIAEFDGEPIAGVIPYYFAGKTWFLFGMSRDKFREKMPNYLLQWSVISKAKALGCRVYDLWGAPDHFHREDPMWGVYKFKAGFGAQVVRRLGAWDLVLRPTFFQLYTAFLPKLLNVLRSRARNRIRQDLSV